MKLRQSMFALIAMIAMTLAPCAAQARGGGGGGGGGGHGGGGGWHGGGSGWHGGGGWHGWYGVGFYYGPGYWGWPYYYPYYYGYPDYAYAGYAPQVEYYADPAAQGAAVPAQRYWYYCTDPAGYYPYVANCTQAWMPVVPQSVPSPTQPPPRVP